MIRQDDPRFGTDADGKWLKDYGCAYFSVLYYCNKYLNTPFNIAKIKIYFKDMQSKGCFTENLDIIWKEAFKYFGLNVSVKTESPTYKVKKGEFVIGKWYNEKTGYSHFTPVDGKVCTFDSLGCSNTVSAGELESIRVMKILKD